MKQISSFLRFTKQIYNLNQGMVLGSSVLGRRFTHRETSGIAWRYQFRIKAVTNAGGAIKMGSEQTLESCCCCCCSLEHNRNSQQVTFARDAHLTRPES